MNIKLTVKDLINIGIFSAMYIVTMMVIVTLLGSVPVLYLMAPFFVGIGCAVVYTLLTMRVPKTGAILILSSLLAILFVSSSWIAAPYVILCGLLAEWVRSSAGWKSERGIHISFLIMSCSTVGPYLGILFMKSQFIESCAEYYGPEYAQTLASLTPPWLILPLIVLSVFGAVIGNTFAKKTLNKHFRKAGMVQ